MDRTITINTETCIRCGHCVRVCPSRIFSQEKPKSPVGVDRIYNCIVCGHCVAVCPTASVVHSDFPEGTVHKIDRKALPSSEQMMELIRSRRSNRAFTDKPVPAEYLDLIVEAAYRAPTASNMQQTSFTVITDPEKLRMVIDYTINYFQANVRMLENPFVKPFVSAFAPSMKNVAKRLGRIVKEAHKGNDMILRGATALIFIHTPRTNRFAMEDCNIAYQNASLMAESLNVAHFYTGFVCTVMHRDKKDRLARALGIDGHVYAGMALGMPEFLYPNYPDKKPIVATEL